MKGYNLQIKNIVTFLTFLIFIFGLNYCKEVQSQNDTLKQNINKYKSSVYDLSYVSNIASDTLGYLLYKPKEKSFTKLPVLFLLHGHGGNQYDWFDKEEGDLKRILDSLIKNKSIPPVVAVSIEARNSWYVNSDILKMENIYIKEFIPMLKAKLKDTINEKKYHLVGNSMGGYGALNYGLKYPKFFNSVMLLAPAAYHPLPPAISSSRKIPVYKKEDEFDELIWRQHLYIQIKLDEDRSIYPKFYLSTGDDDEFDIFNVVVQLNSFFEKNEIEKEVTVVNGNHSWKVWRECFVKDVVRMFEY